MARENGGSPFRHRGWVGIALGIGLAATSAAAQTAVPPTARDFALAAVQSDQYEIQAGQLAVAQSRNRLVRRFAQEMIDNHSRTTQNLNDAALASGLPPPPLAMGSDQAAMLAALQGLRGSAFDQAYAKQQVLAHDQALAVEQSYAAAGSDPNLRNTARAAVPIIQHHLEMALRLRKEVESSEHSSS